MNIGLIDIDYNKEYLSSVIAHNLIKKQYKEIYKKEAKEEIKYNGKPYFPEAKEFKYNISHTYGKILIAFSDKEIGVDIEIIKPVSNLLIRKFYSQAEKDYINKKWSRCKKIERAVEIWTRKEAICKYFGTGITKKGLLLDTCSIKGLFIKSFKVEGYIFSICSTKQEKIDFI